MLRALLLAAPGAGKGTQGKKIADRYGVPHLATGDLLHDHVRRETGLGQQAKAHMDSGGLVPDELVNAMVLDRIGGASALQGFVLDGFPRTMAQAEAAYGWGKASGRTFHAVLVLDVNEDELVRRLVERGLSSGRSDDTENVIRNRLEVYDQLTAPLMDFYEERGILVRLDGEGPVDEVTQRICAALDPIVEWPSNVEVRGEDDVVVATIDDGKVGVLGAAEITSLHHGLQLAITTKRPLVITGRPGAFCAGLDNAVANDDDVLRAMGQLLIDLITAPVPVVAAADGHAVAGGAMLLLAADYSVVGANGRVGFSEVGHGIPLADLPIVLARHRLRPRAVLGACAHGELVSAEVAVIDGWADERASDPRTMAIAAARRLARLDAAAYASTKARVWEPDLDALRVALRR